MGTCQSRTDGPNTVDRNNQESWMNNVSQYTSEKYSQATDYIAPRIAQAQIDYAPQLDKAKINYDIARMYALNYRNEDVVDDSEVKFITEFEKELPLRNISLVEFERRLKKLVSPSMQDMVPVKVVEECFKDHWAFTDIAVDETLTRQLMFNEMFLDEQTEDEIGEPLGERRLYVPWVMLLGLLYCRSNRRQRAEKFYELIEIELTESLATTDKEFRSYIPIMFEIVYMLMMELYPDHRNQTPDCGQPEVNTDPFTPDSDQKELIKEAYMEKWVSELFQKKTRLKREELEDRLTDRIFYLLQPHDIRQKGFKQFKQLEEKEKAQKK